MSGLRQQLANDEGGVGLATRIASLWALVGITSWADFAAFVAAIYSLLLIGEWLWKRLGRPFAERHNWLARKHRRKDDV